MKWTTQANEYVGVGDLVALWVAGHRDAVGRIVAEASNGLIECVLERGGYAKPGLRMTVAEDQLLIRVRR